MTNWTELSAQAALASHRLVGWMFWDPYAIGRYTALGVPDGLGYYITSRAAPLLPAGHEAVAAAFATIHPGYIQMCVDTALAHTTAEAIYSARNEAVGVGLREFVPEICEELAGLAEPLWATADQLSSSGRVFFAAHRQMPRTDDQLVSAWLAVNTIREWRGDTHFAVLVAEDIDAATAGVLDDARRDYGGWLARSRGADDASIDTALAGLEARGLAEGGAVNEAGLEYREEIEQRTDRLAARPWELLGEQHTREFIDLVEPVGEQLVHRIDVTAGPGWMPAARDLQPSHRA